MEFESTADEEVVKPEEVREKLSITFYYSRELLALIYDVCPGIKEENLEPKELISEALFRLIESRAATERQKVLIEVLRNRRR